MPYLVSLVLPALVALAAVLTDEPPADRPDRSPISLLHPPDR